MSKLYVSYVREEIEEAQRLVSEIKTYLPAADIALLHICNSEILTNSDVILCMFSNNYKKSSDFQQECTLAANLNKTVILLEYKECGFFEKLKRSSLMSELQKKLRSDNYQWYDKKGRDECLRRLIACLGLEVPIGNVTGTLVKFDIRSKRSFTYTIAGKTGSMPEGRVVDVRLPDGSYKCVFSPTDYPECVIVEQVFFESMVKSVQTKVIDIDSRVDGYLWKIKQEEQEKQEKAREEEERRKREEAERNDPKRQYEQACQYYDEGKYEEAFRCLSRGAELNHSGCQAGLSKLYYFGLGVGQDYKKAFSFAQKSADQGDVDGMRRLGICYRFGNGTRRNIPQAIEYFKRAIEQNDVRSMVCLGDIRHYDEGFKNMSEAVGLYKRAAKLGDGKAMSELGCCYFVGFESYHNGAEETPDYKTAVSWFRKAADAGNAEGQLSLGYCYENGLGVAKNPHDAFKWYKLAADQGNPVAQCNVGNCYVNGWSVTVDKSQAFKYYKAAAEQNYLNAQNRLAWCYYNGDGVPVNYNEAVAWWTRAAEQGYADAQNSLGWWHQNGKGIRDYGKVFHWYKLSAEQGNTYGQYNLALCYWNGNGCDKNIGIALQWFLKAAEQGYSDAQTWVGYIYDVETHNYEEAFKWFKLSAEQGHMVGQYNLAVFYENGRGCSQDLSLARQWYRKSAEQGDEDAKKALDRLK